MKLLSAKNVATKTSFSIPHIHRMAKDGKFPQPIKLSESRKGWLEADVEKWTEGRIREHRHGHGCNDSQ